jgi:hypothetical protein
MVNWKPKDTCEHLDWRYERGPGGSTGDLQCRSCGQTFAPYEPQAEKWLAQEKSKREDASQSAVRVINTIIRKHEGDDATLTDDPNVVKMPKKR